MAVDERPPAFEDTSFDDVPPSYEPAPPAYDDVDPGYDENPVFTRGGDESSSEIFDTPGDPATEQQQQQQQQQAGGQQTVVVEDNSANLVMIFHITSIICCLLSIAFSPLIEIIPAVFCFVFVMKLEPSNTNANRMLNVVDWVVTLIGLLWWIFIAAILTIFSFGFLFWTFFFCIPYIIVLMACTIGAKQFCLKSAQPQSPV